MRDFLVSAGSADTLRNATHSLIGRKHIPTHRRLPSDTLIEALTGLNGPQTRRKTRSRLNLADVVMGAVVSS
jgi:hypothetical protein